MSVLIRSLCLCRPGAFSGSGLWVVGMLLVKEVKAKEAFYLVLKRSARSCAGATCRSSGKSGPTPPRSARSFGSSGGDRDAETYGQRYRYRYRSRERLQFEDPQPRPRRRRGARRSLTPTRALPLAGALQAADEGSEESVEEEEEDDSEEGDDDEDDFGSDVTSESGEVQYDIWWNDDLTSTSQNGAQRLAASAAPAGAPGAPQGAREGPARPGATGTCRCSWCGCRSMSAARSGAGGSRTSWARGSSRPASWSCTPVRPGGWGRPGAASRRFRA